MTCASDQCNKQKYFCFLCNNKLTVIPIKKVDQFPHFFMNPFGNRCKNAQMEANPQVAPQGDPGLQTLLDNGQLKLCPHCKAPTER